MANEPRRGRSRPTPTPQNSATMGVILVVAAVVVAILLFNVGGGTATSSDDLTPAESAAEGRETTTTTEAPAVTTPPANLVVYAANGSGVSGRAGDTAEKLNAIGYSNVKAVDGQSTATTMIYFAAGLENDALALATAMGLPADRVAAMPATSPLKVPATDAALIVLIGPDFDPNTAAIGVPTSGG